MRRNSCIYSEFPKRKRGRYSWDKKESYFLQKDANRYGENNKIGNSKF